jgi:hypothetical protein
LIIHTGPEARCSSVNFSTARPASKGATGTIACSAGGFTRKFSPRTSSIGRETIHSPDAVHRMSGTPISQPSQMCHLYNERYLNMASPSPRSVTYGSAYPSPPLPLL